MSEIRYRCKVCKSSKEPYSVCDVVSGVGLMENTTLCSIHGTYVADFQIISMFLIDGETIPHPHQPELVIC